MHRRVVCLAGLLLTGSVGCLKWYSDQVASGIGRLTMRHLGAVASMTHKDALCGFASDTVLDRPRIEGELGGLGRVTWQVSDCRIESPDWRSTATDCNGAQTRVRGAFTVTAKMIVEGRITGDAATPVVPEDAQALMFVLEDVRFEHFAVEVTGSDAALRIDSGGLSGSLQPRLALGTSGVCSEVTPHATFRDVVYRDARVQVRTADRDFEADVQTSNLSAQSGVLDAQENTIGGTLTVWHKQERVPADDDGLDPEYDATSFTNSFSCDAAIAKPLQYDCRLTPLLGRGTARLSVRSLGVLMSLVNDSAECGFENADIVAGYTFTGEVGRIGSVTYTVNNCVIDLPSERLLGTDCLGEAFKARGRAVVSGRKTVQGYVTGDPTLPVVPVSRDAIEFDLSAVVTDWTVTSTVTDRYIVLQSGRVSGIVQPRTAMDTEVGVCSVPTPVASFQDLRMQDAEVRLQADGRSFDIAVSDSHLSGAVGAKNGLENHLEGELLVDDELVVMQGDDAVLDPSYERGRFFESFACTEGMTIPDSDAGCSLEPALAEGAARLTVFTLGYATKVIENDTTCGFKSADDLIPASLQAEGDGAVTAIWSAADCRVNIVEPWLADHDCLGNDVFVTGQARMSASKAVTGALAVGYPPILPSDRRSVRYAFQNIELKDFTVLPAWADDRSPRYMEVHQATLRGIVDPIVGEAVDPSGALIIGTPVTGFSAVELVQADVTLHVGAKQFRIDIDATDLEAQAGSFEGASNSLAGSITVAGTTYAIAPTFLDPAFDQAVFDASYACWPNLRATVPAD